MTSELRDYSERVPRNVFLQISVSPEAADDEAVLVALSYKLAAKFSKVNAIDALIFDDSEAARKLKFLYTDQPNYSLSLWHFRARFRPDK